MKDASMDVQTVNVCTGTTAQVLRRDAKTVRYGGLITAVTGKDFIKNAHQMRNVMKENVFLKMVNQLKSVRPDMRRSVIMETSIIMTVAVKEKPAIRNALMGV